MSGAIEGQEPTFTLAAARALFRAPQAEDTCWADVHQRFKIDASRMETDGKGESQPVDKNDNPAGKANNRRVEFIKK